MNAVLDSPPERAGPEDRDDGTRGTGDDGPRGHPPTGSTGVPSDPTGEERPQRVEDADDLRRDFDVDDGDDEHVLAALYGDEADLDASVEAALLADPDAPGGPPTRTTRTT